jgi:hypothetical protein
VACGYDGVRLMMFTDGRPGDSEEISLSLLASSPMAMGQAAGYSAHAAAPMEVGPFRWSRVVRYNGTFAPRQQWTVDAETVSQHLVELGLMGQSLTDEAGRGHDGLVRRDVNARSAPDCRP